MSVVAVQLDGVTFSYGETKMAFDLAVPAGTIVAVMGPSGSGKSTLLNLIAGFARPDAGLVLIGDDDVTRLTPAQRPISMVFQENNLFGHLDVASNIGLGRSPSLRLTQKDRDDIEAAMAQTGLTGKGKRLPSELSGGERQRVALARVLVRDRPVLLLDEPFASLGPALRQEMLELVRDLHSKRKMTILMVTHHPEDARALAGQVAFVENGRIEAFEAASVMFSDSAPSSFRNYIGS